MNARKVLHELVEKLPDSELVTAARILRALEEPAAINELLAFAPEDDEPFDAADIAGVEDEPLVPHEEVAQQHRG
jgi:gamma-glutamylcysteine synthetase